jgi:hypothetical protein
MKIDLEKLVSEARADLQKSKDNKKWCRTDQIIALLEAGAIPININERLSEISYLHEVSYEGIIFTNATSAPAQELEKYSVK